MDITLETIKQDLEDCIERKYLLKDVIWLVERVESMERVLDAARHSLTTLTGLVACDDARALGGVFDGWEIDERKAIREINRVLKPLHGGQ